MNRKRLPSLCPVNLGVPDTSLLAGEGGWDGGWRLLEGPVTSRSPSPWGLPPPGFFCHIRTDKRAQRDLPKTEGRTGGPLTPATICAVSYVPLSKVGAGDLCQPLRPGEPTF